MFVATPGYTFSRVGLPPGAVITHVKGVPTPTLEAFEAEMARYPDGAMVPLRYWLLESPRSPGIVAIRVDRRWFSMQRCTRDDTTGRWPCTASPEPPPAEPRSPVTTSLEVDGERAVRAIAPSLVMVEYDIPYRLDGVHGDRFHGTGLVVDADRGLVVVDRETVPIALGDLSVVVGGSVRVPGEVVYLHPEHNLAVIRYDPALLGDTPVRSATLRAGELEPGERVYLVGLSIAQRIVSRETKVARREPILLPPTHPPRFQESNLELIAVEDATSTVGGVLTDSKGRVRAFWASFSAGSGNSMEAFFAGVPVRQVERMIAPLRDGRPVGWRSLDIELEPLTLAEARARGLDAEQASRLEAHDPKGRRVLAVRSIAAGGPAEGVLRPGDLLISIDGRPVTRFYDVEAASVGESVALRVLRDGAVLDLVVPTAPLDGIGTDRAVIWAGTLLQKPPRALSRQQQLPREGVYVARYWFGSPANRYGVQATSRIVEVDGTPTPDLDHFLAAVRDKADRDSLRLELADLDGRVSVVTLVLDLDYWPTFELIRGEEGWVRRRL